MRLYTSSRFALSHMSLMSVYIWLGGIPVIDMISAGSFLSSHSLHIGSARLSKPTIVFAKIVPPRATGTAASPKHDMPRACTGSPASAVALRTAFTTRCQTSSGSSSNHPGCGELRWYSS